MTPLALALLTVDLIVLAVVWTNVGRVQHDPELSPYYRRYVVEAADAAQVGALLPAIEGLLGVWLTIDLSAWLPTVLAYVRAVMTRGLTLAPASTSASHSASDSVGKANAETPFWTIAMLLGVWCKCIVVGIALWFTLTITTYITPVIKQVSFDPEDSADSVHLAQVLSVLNSAATAMMLALIVGWLQQNLCFYQVGKLHGAS